MTLPDLWFGIIAVLWTGFFVLEGFDFGVGALHGVVGRTERERRVAINSIGPFWDGNEVWLIVGGAAIFAAFPSWYATWFSAGYLAMVLILAALIARGVSFEFRGKVDTPQWRRTWSTTLTVGSLLAPLLIGVALGDLLAGLPVDANEEFTGSFLDLLTPFGLLTGLTLLLLCLLHGASFLALRTTGRLRERALRLGRVLALVALVATIAYGASIATLVDVGPVTTAVLVVAALGVLLAAVALGRRDGIAFSATASAIGLTVVSLFTALYPNVLVSTTNTAFSLTVAGTASGTYALQVMSVTALVLLPVVLVYQGWNYVVFRHRLSTPHEAARPDRSAATGRPSPSAGEPPPLAHPG